MTIDAFQEKVMGIRPNNFMALNGAAAGILGSADSGTDAVLQLQRAVIAFTQAYKENNDQALLAATHKEVLAKIMVAVTMGSLGEQQADELVDVLQKLMKERN